MGAQVVQITSQHSDTRHTFSKRDIISFLTSFWGFPDIELGAIDGESLKRSSIPEAGCDLVSSSFAGVIFSVEDDTSAAAVPEHEHPLKW